MYTTPNPIDLTTLAAVEAWAGNTANPTADATTLQGLITSASFYFLKRTGRGPQNGAVPTQSPFVQPVSYVDTYDGMGGNRQILRNWPAQSVSEVLVDVSPFFTGVELIGWLLDSTGESISVPQPMGTGLLPSFWNGGAASGTYGGGWGARRFGCPVAFPRGYQNVQVSYIGGFPLTAITNELDTVPASGPFVITVQELPWISDGGVKYFSSGTPLTPVTIAPLAGQYYLQGGGSYLFNSADANAEMQISYNAAGTPPDVVEKITELVALNYKRKGWIDQKSQMIQQGGTVSYRDWKTFPQFEELVEYYMQRAMV
jgi:hypothetical protein